MSPRPLFAAMLAAGEGTRMRSSRPKALAKICGKPMGTHVLEALFRAGVQDTVVVVGHGAERVKASLSSSAPVGMKIHFVEQQRLLGTADALSVALTGFPDVLNYSKDDIPVVIVVPGDTPLITPGTLRELVEIHIESRASATLITATLEDAFGYGRIVRGKDGRVAQVVEHIRKTGQCYAECVRGSKEPLLFDKVDLHTRRCCRRQRGLDSLCSMTDYDDGILNSGMKKSLQNVRAHGLATDLCQRLGSRRPHSCTFTSRQHGCE